MITLNRERRVLPRRDSPSASGALLAHILLPALCCIFKFAKQTRGFVCFNTQTNDILLDQRIVLNDNPSRRAQALAILTNLLVSAEQNADVPLGLRGLGIQGK